MAIYRKYPQGGCLQQNLKQFVEKNKKCLFVVNRTITICIK